MTSSGLTNHEGGWEQAFAQMFDMSTFQKHSDSMLESDYRSFIYDIFFSAKVKDSDYLFYGCTLLVVDAQLSESSVRIIEKSVKDNMVKWHEKHGDNLAISFDGDPSYEVITYSVASKEGLTLVNLEKGEWL